jgi:phosphohistidine phosphatase
MNHYLTEGGSNMALYLVQHGKSLPKDKDPEQGLSVIGEAEVERVARMAMEYNIHVRQIFHSGKERARQTAHIFHAALGPQEQMREMQGLKPLDDVTEIVPLILAEPDLMLVGHLPFMERLASYLITGSTDKRVIKFQNGGIVCLVRESGQGEWFIKWALMPEIE